MWCTCFNFLNINITMVEGLHAQEIPEAMLSRAVASGRVSQCSVWLIIEDQVWFDRAPNQQGPARLGSNDWIQCTFTWAYHLQNRPCPQVRWVEAKGVGTGALTPCLKFISGICHLSGEEGVRLGTRVLSTGMGTYLLTFAVCVSSLQQGFREWHILPWASQGSGYWVVVLANNSACLWTSS